MTELNCNELVELVTDYLDGALDPETRARVESHLTQCDGCSGYLAQIQETVRRLGDLSPDDLPGDAYRDLSQAFRDWRAGSV